MTESERYSWLCLALMPHIGADSFLRLIQYFGNADTAWHAHLSEIQNVLTRKQAIEAWQHRRAEAEQAAQQALQWENQENCRLLLLADDDFPLMLSEGITPPPLLFARGNTQLLHQPAVAIVGSRHATPQAMRIAHDFAFALAEKNITVISGMAAGIDTAAHQGALQQTGSTVAVWGTGIDRIYPPSNKNLAHEISQQGVVISEFPLGTRPLAGNFPRRNRLIAALAQAVLVVEAALESGSLITAKLAAEIGREVMAVPGSIDNPHSKGCHKLIKEGAKLTENLEDILQECPQLLPNPTASSYSIYKENAYNIQTASKQSDNMPSEHAKNQDSAIKTQMPSEKLSNIAMPSENPILNAMGYDSIHPDTLAEQLQLTAADIHAALLELELDGKIAALSGGRYQRIKS